MNKNLGTFDRVMRFVFSIVLFYFGIFYFYNFILKIVLAIFGLLMIIESLISYCYLYQLFGINTKEE